MDQHTPDARDQRSGAYERLQRVRQFLNEVLNELKRVTWPTAKEIYATTIVVIVISVVLGLYLWSLDRVLDRLVFWIYGRFGED